MTATLIGPPDTSWQPCEEHGIPYSQCWACNKPAGRCSYGLCGEAPTHVVTGSGRWCCEQHARYLASINGGEVRELAPDPGAERAPEQGADEVVITLIDGDARTAPVLRDAAGGGSYACPWCQSPVFSPEAWEEHERQNAVACERLGEVHQPQPYHSTDAAAWQARGCANPMCWVNLPAGQLTEARRRREETEARDRERDHARQARQRYKDEYGQRRHADNQTWDRLQADAGIPAPPSGSSHARRGDLIVVCQEHPSFGAGDPYDSYTVGVVTSVTRDGGVKAYRPAGDFPEPEHAGRSADKGTDLARQRPDRFWVLPAGSIDVPAALATAACHTWPDSQLPQPYESLEEIHAVMQPHLATAPAGRREALRAVAARWDDARRHARACDGYEARLAAARDADEAYRRAAQNSALRIGDRIIWHGQTYDLLEHVPAAATITARTIPPPGPRDPLNRDLDIAAIPLAEAVPAPFDRAHAVQSTGTGGSGTEPSGSATTDSTGQSPATKTEPPSPAAPPPASAKHSRPSPAPPITASTYDHAPSEGATAMIVIVAGPACTLSACTWGELAKEYTSQAFFAGLITLAAAAIVITMLTRARRRGRR